MSRNHPTYRPMSARFPAQSGTSAERQWTQEEDMILEHGRSDGLAIEDIAATLGREPLSVGLRIHALGRRDSGISSPGRHGRPWTKSLEKRLLSLYQEGTALSEIAKLLGRTHGAIIARLAKLGFECAG